MASNVKGGSDKCKCGQLRAPSSRWCLDCKAESTRAWRARNGIKYKNFTLDEKKKADARSAVHMAIRRGKMAKGTCEFIMHDGKPCGLSQVHAHHDDYDKPLVVRWVCRWHHPILELRKKVTIAAPPRIWEDSLKSTKPVHST